MRTRLISLVAAAAAPLAMAQDVAPAPSTAASAVAARAPASAVQTVATLPAVIVTGEKSIRSLDKTAPSVKVWGAGDLDANPGLRSNRALLDNTVNVIATGTQNLAPAVRGIDGTGPSQGSDAFLAGTRSRLNLFDSKRPLPIEADPSAASGAADVGALPGPRAGAVGLEAWF